MRHFPIGALLLAALLPATAATTAPAPAGHPAVAPSALAASMPPGHAPMTAQRNRPKPVEHYVDINSADRKELMTLQGIGGAEADKIIANRPYLTKTELVTKRVLPEGPFFSIKNQIVAMQKFKKPAKAKG